MSNKLILLSTLFLTCFTLSAETKVKPVGGESGKKEVPMESKSARPTDNDHDSDSNIECYYENGALHISFDRPEGAARLRVTSMESGYESTASFPTFTPYTYYMGTAEGTYEINVDTSKNGYIGYLTIEE